MTLSRHTKPSTRQRGVTLIEAAIVLTVTAVIAGTAAPSLRAVIDGRRLDAAANQLATDSASPAPKPSPATKRCG